MIISVPMSLEPESHYDEALNPYNCVVLHMMKENLFQLRETN